MSMNKGKERRRIIPIPATAGDVAYTLSPSCGKKWKILRAYITIVCNATSVTRFFGWMVTDKDGNITEWLGQGHDITASQSGYSCLCCVHELINAKFDVDVDGIGINDLVLVGDEKLQLMLGSGVAGDTYSGYVVVLESKD